MFSSALSAADVLAIKSYGVAAFPPPEIDLNGPASAGDNFSSSYAQNTNTLSTLEAADAAITQSFSADLTTMTATLSGNTDGIAEVLDADVSATPLISKNYNAGTGVLSLSGSDTWLIISRSFAR